MLWKYHPILPCTENSADVALCTVKVNKHSDEFQTSIFLTLNCSAFKRAEIDRYISLKCSKTTTSRPSKLSTSINQHAPSILIPLLLCITYPARYFHAFATCVPLLCRISDTKYNRANLSVIGVSGITSDLMTISITLKRIIRSHIYSYNDIQYLICSIRMINCKCHSTCNSASLKSDLS